MLLKTLHGAISVYSQMFGCGFLAGQRGNSGFLARKPNLIFHPIFHFPNVSTECDNCCLSSFINYFVAVKIVKTLIYSGSGRSSVDVVVFMRRPVHMCSPRTQSLQSWPDDKIHVF